MTIIAYDRKAVSVDSLISSGNIRAGSAEKFIALPQGGYAFACGDWGASRSIFMALLASETPDASHYSDCTIITIDNNGKVWEQDGCPHKEPVRRAWAWGSGRELALGALLAGASSKKAAEIAAKYDSTCGGTVHTFTTR